MRSVSRFILSLSALLLVGAGCAGSSNETLTQGPAGVFMSPDKGESWRSVSVLPGVEGNQSLSGVSVFKLVEDPQDSRAMWWGSRGQGVLHSFDGAKSWKLSAAPLNRGFIYGIAVHPKNKCLVLASNGRQLLRTDDCARSWQTVYEEVRKNVTIRTAAFDPFGRHNVLMIQSNGDMYKSVDTGSSWALHKRFRTKLRDIQFDKNRQGAMYIASKEKGLYRSLDGGDTWVSLSDKLADFSGGLDFRYLLVYPGAPNTLYWVSKYGILTSRNGGDVWEAFPLVTPPGSVNIYGFAVNPKNPKEIYYTATQGARSTFYRSVDTGSSWVTRKLPSGQIPTALRVNPSNSDQIFMGFTIPTS